jgi:hypothetical protein
VTGLTQTLREKVKHTDIVFDNKNAKLAGTSHGGLGAKRQDG